MRIERGKKICYEVSGDLADDHQLEDNDALEDKQRALAKAAKKKVVWSSEADTFVAQATDLETSRWIIDTLNDMKRPRRP